MLWMNKLLPIFETNLPELNSQEKKEFLKKMNTENYLIKFEKLAHNYSVSKFDSFRTINFKNCFEGKIISIKEIRKLVDPSEKTLLVSIDTQGRTFDLVDNLGVFPKNSKDNIIKALGYFKMDPDMYVNFETSSELKETIFPFASGLKVKNVLTNHLDLHGQVTLNNQKDRHFKLLKMLKKRRKRKNKKIRIR